MNKRNATRQIDAFKAIVHTMECGANLILTPETQGC